MGTPAEKPDVGFQEALRRIAQTPKEVVDKVVNQRRDDYNSKHEATDKPPLGKRKPSE